MLDVWSSILYVRVDELFITRAEYEGHPNSLALPHILKQSLPLILHHASCPRFRRQVLAPIPSSFSATQVWSTSYPPAKYG